MKNDIFLLLLAVALNSALAKATLLELTEVVPLPQEQNSLNKPAKNGSSINQADEIFVAFYEDEPKMRAEIRELSSQAEADPANSGFTGFLGDLFQQANINKPESK